ncbi:MAG: PDZ domain-containing protein [Chitinophagaceae bacterium]|nr:PDZ domain-containing protein [Chitinophagaceae bacterium]
MNTSMYKRSALAFVAAACVFATTGLQAQEKKNKKTKQEQIIIKKRGDKEEKTTIVIDGDNVTINGKPANEYKGDVSVNLRDDDIDFDISIDGDGEGLAAIAPMPPLPPMPPVPPVPSITFTAPDFNFEDGDMSWTGVSKPMLGVYTEKDEKGAKITNVVDDSPAEKAGLLKGDIITKIGETAVTDPSSLSSIINEKKPDDEIQITYLRDKKEKKVTLKLGERKDSFTRSFNFNAPQFNEDLVKEFKFNGPGVFNNRARLGIKIQDTEEGNGVKVIELEDASAAAKSGIKKDDIITSIDGADIKSTDDARQKMLDVKEKAAYPVKVLRNGLPVTIDVKIPKKLKTTDL